MKVHWKIWFLGEVHEKTIIQGGLPKKGLGQFADLIGGLAKKRGVDTPMYITMIKEGNMESKKWVIYVNPTVWSDTRVAFCIYSPSKVLGFMLYVLYFVKSVFGLSNWHWKCQEFLVHDVRIMSGMWGISDLKFEW